MPPIGAHMSITGGFHKAVERLLSVGGEALQIFCKNQRQWSASPLQLEEVKRFRHSWQSSGRMPVAVHAGYLINLASPDKALAMKSVKSFVDELERTATLGIPYMIIHPGSHRGSGLRQGIRRFARNLDRSLNETRARPMWILLETTAGQGTNLGSTFEELAEIMEKSRYSHCIGVCIDTAHIFAAGYDIRTSESFGKVLERFDKLAGLDRIKFFHLNDSIGGLGSHKDRHTHIGQGAIGIEAFRFLVNNPRFSHVPMVIETPKEKGLEMDRRNITVLKNLINSC